MTIKDRLTQLVKNNSGYTEFEWNKTKDNRMVAKDNKGKTIAEYNLSNAKLKIL